jgi:circadian clock protein KaiC
MSTVRQKGGGPLGALRKSPTGIQGLDEITGGGLPAGRPTLICGSAGCGKTLFGTEFLVHGATRYGEPGVFMSFEETGEELTKNVASLGFDLNDLVARKKLLIDHVQIERSEIEETGEYDLEALFIRLGYAIDSIGARRVVLDSLESLFAALPNEAILRAELRRLFSWLKEKGMTAIITGERGAGTLTRQGLEEYVSDCVILLDHRVNDLISTRRLRVVKYRGSTHGTNEYPFLIDEHGISVLPITSLGLDHKVSSERVDTGIPGLNEMLGGEGFYRGSSILVSGTPGTGKSSVAAHVADAACSRGERCIYFAFEESEQQIIRNMRSIGVDLGRWVKRGILRFHAARPSAFGLEMHLAKMHMQINQFEPSFAIVDPITNLFAVGARSEIQSVLTRLIDSLKKNNVTSVFTSLTHGGSNLEHTDVGLSSLMDTWILLRNIESSGERNRGIHVLKSRGMSHSNQIREFRLTDNRVQLTDVYIGPAGVLTGAARAAQEAREKAEEQARRQEIERKQRSLDHKRSALEAQIAALRRQFELEAQEIGQLITQEKTIDKSLNEEKTEMARIRKQAARAKNENRRDNSKEPARTDGRRRSK